MEDVTRTAEVLSLPLCLMSLRTDHLSPLSTGGETSASSRKVCQRPPPSQTEGQLKDTCA